MMNLAHPGWLWLLPVLLIPLIAWYIYSQDKNEPEMNVSSTRAFDGMGTSWKVWAKHLSFALKMGALACLVIILCRPQTKDSWSTSDVEGTDIVKFANARPLADDNEVAFQRAVNFVEATRPVVEPEKEKEAKK